MRITIKKTIDITPALETYIENKLAPLAKFVKHFEENGEAELWLELSRTTRHHRKGEVFFAAVDLKVPKKILRAEAYAENIRTAIDEAKDMLRLEIKKYKTTSEDTRRAAQK